MRTAPTMKPLDAPPSSPEFIMSVFYLTSLASRPPLQMREDRANKAQQETARRDEAPGQIMEVDRGRDEGYRKGREARYEDV